MTIMTRQDIEALFAHNLDELRSAVCAISANLGRELAPTQLGWIGTASKRQLLIETMFMLANTRSS